MNCLVLSLLSLLPLVTAIPINNGIVGDPEIDCGAKTIAVTFNTQNNFEGHVYVKGRYAEPACRKDGDRTRATGSIELSFDSCGVNRERSASPRGMFMRTTVVVSFHPNFITKIDRAYTIQCFYMEADKTVSAELEVSMITTGFQTQNVPMPVCRYEILSSGTPGATPVSFAIIGMPVYHKWTCDTETTDIFCMTVYGCFVEDGAGERVTLLDETGCALDKYLLGNLEYPTDLMAGREVHVFKFADRPQLFFQCQIRIQIKEPNAQCVRTQCTQPGGSGDGTASGKVSGTGGAAAGAGGSGGNSTHPAAAPSGGAPPQQPAGGAVGQPATPGAPPPPAAGGATTAVPAGPAAPAVAAGNNTASGGQPPPGQPSGARAFFRFKRQVEDSTVATVDVSAQIESLDANLLDDQARSLTTTRVSSDADSNGVCMSTGSFTLLAAFVLLVITAVLVVAGYLWIRQTRC